MKAFISVLLYLVVTVNESKIYRKCKLARILHDAGMAGFQGISLANWVCLAFHASQLDSEKVHTDPGSVRRFGMFQLSNTEHCRDHAKDSTNLCHTCCVYFLNDELADDIECLKRHAIQHGGLAYWAPWRDNCAGRRLHQYVKNCNLKAD